jgi:hypothetical protein
MNLNAFKYEDIVVNWELYLMEDTWFYVDSQETIPNISMQDQ